MAGVVLSLDDRDVQHALSALSRLLVDTRPLLAEFGEIVLSQTQDSFERQAAPDGTPWEPSQRALAFGGQTLVDSGQLLASLDVEVLPDAVVVGTNKHYAAIHQFGGQAGRSRKTKITARPYLPDAGTVDMAAIRRSIERYFRKAVN